MANNNTPVSKIKIDNEIFYIKDILARDSKLNKNNAIGNGRLTFNAENLTQGSNSISLGYLNAAGGNCAFALGSQNNAAAAFSGTLGFGLITSGASQIVLGKYNLPLITDAFEIGNGENENNRENILRVTKTGTLYIKNDIKLGSTSDNDQPISLINKLHMLETAIIDSQYSLPLATKDTLGGVIIGNNINVDKNGRISVVFPEYTEYELPIASSQKLGGIKIGSHLDIDEDGILNVIYPEIPEEYTLPLATATELGGIKVSSAMGFKLSNDGVLTYAINKLNQQDPNGTGYIRMNSSGNAGLYSVSLGNSNMARGESSIGLGYQNTVTGVAAAAIGRENDISGDVAIGLGKSLKVTKENSVAIGLASQITGEKSYSLGEGLKLSNNQTYAIGKYNENLNDSFLEIGQGTADNSRKNIFKFTNNGDAYFTNNLFVSKDEDNNPINILSRINEIAENTYTLPIASPSILGGIKVGNNLTIDEDGVLSATVEFNSHNLSCTGYFSHNRVSNTNIGTNSFASNGSALSSNSVAFGYGTVAGKEIVDIVEIENPETGEITEEEVKTYSGSYAFSEGINSIAEGYASFAGGEGSKAGYDNQFVIGKYNDNKITSLFEIGYGDSDDNRVNLLELSKTGILKVNGININTGVLSVTESEYEAFTQAEKNRDIIYLITDTNELYYKENKYGSGSGGGSGNVEDVYVNGSSVLDENHIAQVKSYVELTQAEYDALPASKLTDNILYCIKDTGIVEGDQFAPIIYSFEEREVGTWTDGKPLYQKTVLLSSIPSNDIQTYPLNIDNRDIIVNYKCMLIFENGQTYDINKSRGDMPSDMTYALITSTNDFFVRTYRDIYTNAIGYVTVWYTKTTDTPGSGNWTTQGVPAIHYSTDEQIIGTWIDGKPLYQKVIDIGNLPNSGTKSVLHNITNIKRVIEIHGSALSSNTGNSVPLPYIYPNGTQYLISIVVTLTQINIVSGMDRSNLSGYVILKYTKTTD